jgi:hypothetical protein
MLPRPENRGPRLSGAQKRDGRRESVPVLLRIVTPIDAAYIPAGEVMPYVLDHLLTETQETAETN